MINGDERMICSDIGQVTREHVFLEGLAPFLEFGHCKLFNTVLMTEIGGSLTAVSDIILSDSLLLGLPFLRVLKSAS